MVTVTIVAGAVPAKGSGSPDYSRTAVGSSQTPLAQVSGLITTSLFSGATVYGGLGVPQFPLGIRDGNLNAIELWSEASGLTVRAVRVLVRPEMHNNGPDDGGQQSVWDRVRSVKGISGYYLSGMYPALAVGTVSGLNVVQVTAKPVTSGGTTRYLRGVIASAGDFVVTAPASGKALLIIDLHDSYLGNSGASPVAYRIGQTSPTIYDHQVGATFPNWRQDLSKAPFQGPIRAVSGVADLVIVVGLTVASGIGYTAVVEDA